MPCPQFFCFFAAEVLFTFFINASILAIVALYSLLFQFFAVRVAITII